MINSVDNDYSELRQQVDEAGFARSLGLQLRELSQGYAVVTMRTDDRLENWYGRLHGGAILALADQALGAAASTIPGGPVAIQLNINFISSPARGAELTATARQVHVGRRVAVFEVEVHDHDSRLVAQGQATGLCQREAR